MAFESKNMNYVFNVEYFENIETLLNDAGNEIKKRNRCVENFSFPQEDMFESLGDLPLADGHEYCFFSLYTQYPGLLVGIGNSHDAKLEEAIKCGFNFDYVTGIPYIPGSSLKGMLRSFFPGDAKDPNISKEYDSYIRELLGEEGELDVLKLKNNIFEGNDIFLDAFPDMRRIREGIMKMDYITPHEKFKEPNPISIIKVKPKVPFIFSFLLTDYTIDEKTIINKQEKLTLFEKLILDMGIGAKTNVGFGKFAKN